MFVSRINELLAERNRRERGRKTYDQGDIAEFVGVSRQTVSGWASAKGIQTIDSKYTTLLCMFFGCDVWQLWEHVPDDGVRPAARIEDLGQVVPGGHGVAIPPGGELEAVSPAP